MVDDMIHHTFSPCISHRALEYVIIGQSFNYYHRKAAFSIQLSSYGNKTLEEVVMKEYRERNYISNPQNVPTTKIGSKL